MTPTSGQISMADLRAEISTSSTAQCSMNDSDIGPLFRYWVVNTQNSITTFYNATAKPDLTWIAGTHTATSSGSYAEIGIALNYYGNIELRKYQNGSNTYTYGDWSPIANVETSGDYEIKYVHISGVAPSNNFDAENTFEPFDRNLFLATGQYGSAGTTSSTFDVTIQGVNGGWNGVTQRTTITATWT